MTSVDCEKLIIISVPAIRAALVTRLNSEGMHQVEIARRLGITQALVSKYTHGRYSSRVRRLSAALEGSDQLAGIATRVHGGATASDTNSMIDSLAASGPVIDVAAKLFGKSVLE